MEEKRLSPLKAIRAKCVECKGVHKSMKCENDVCPLHPYHTGKTGRTRKLTDEQREAAKARMSAFRKAAEA